MTYFYVVTFALVLFKSNLVVIVVNVQCIASLSPSSSNNDRVSIYIAVPHSVFVSQVQDVSECSTTKIINKEEIKKN